MSGIDVVVQGGLERVGDSIDRRFRHISQIDVADLNKAIGSLNIIALERISSVNFEEIASIFNSVLANYTTLLELITAQGLLISLDENIAKKNDIIIQYDSMTNTTYLDEFKNPVT